MKCNKILLADGFENFFFSLKNFISLSDVIQSFLLMIVCFWGLFQNPKMDGQWRGVTFKKLN